MSPHTTTALAAILGGSLLLPLVQDPRPADPTAALAARLKDVEDRLAYLETFHPARPAPLPEIVVPVTIASKKWFAADGELMVKLRCDFREIEKPVRAVKGSFEFHDLFGALKHRHVYPFQNEIPADGWHVTPSQWLRGGSDGARWAASTSNRNIVVTYRVAEILYADGEIVKCR